jgi:hypothetical protein
MTLPDERFRAVRWAREFMYELMDPKKTPGIPAVVRSQARSVLRHYPNDYDMVQAAEASPDIFQQQMEPVTRLFRAYEEKKNNDRT